MYSKIVKNGQIIDGTGKKIFTGDVAIEQDKIVAIGDLKNAKAQGVIDASGKYVTPGFIDIQNHSDVYWTLFDNPSMDSLVAQGITTVLIGNCGSSLAPLLSRDALLSIQKWHTMEGVNFNWLGFDEYMNELSKRSFGTNIASLVGYSTLRRGLVRNQIRGLTDKEHTIIKKTLEESLAAGAFGLSSGLLYAHEAIISENELMDLARIIKSHNSMLSIHLRSEGAELTESVSEALELVNKINVNLKISHFKVRQKSNWHLLPHALNLIEDSYQKFGNVHFDVYPYDFVWQVLYTYLPKWAYEGGRETILHHLKDPVQRKKIGAYLLSRDIDYSQIYIASTSMALNVVGKNLGEIAKRQNITSEEALMSIIENGGSEVLVFDRNLSETQVEQLLGHSLSMVATDGAGFSPNHKTKLVHPRCFGTMPKFLGWSLSKNIFPLEKAIQKITETPAQKMGMKKRGRIAPDYFADIVIMDAGVGSNANYINPFQMPSGIDSVLVNGNVEIENGEMTGKLSGRAIRKN